MQIAFPAADRANIKPLLFRAFGLSDLDIMHPGREVGNWSRHRSDLAVLRKSDIPGAAVSNALCNGENIYGHCLSVIEAREAARTPKW